MAADSLTVAVAQMNASAEIETNLSWIERVAGRARRSGAEVLFLPENATQLAPPEQRLREAESLDGRQAEALGQIAANEGLWLVVGSMALKGPDPEHTWATTVVFAPDGTVAGTYHKTHLFDVDVAADTSFRESDTIAAGPWSPTVVPIAGWQVGLSICYDLRFPELYRALVDAGAEVLAVPAAFTLRTGMAHWHPLLRARAIENQCFVVAPAQVGRHYGARESYGHALVASPWGTVMAECDGASEYVVACLERSLLRDVRQRLPCLTHRRGPL